MQTYKLMVTVKPEKSRLTPVPRCFGCCVKI